MAQSQQTIPTWINEAALWSYDAGRSPAVKQAYATFYAAFMTEISAGSSATPSGAGNNLKSVQAGARGPSKAVQAIQTALTGSGAEGMTKTTLTTATGLKPDQVVKRLQTMVKGGMVHQKGARFILGAASTTETIPGQRRRGRPAKATGKTQGTDGVTLSDSSLQAVQAFPQGASNAEIQNYLSTTFGIAARPNHVGIALNRHKRAGRLEQRDEKWYPVAQTEGQQRQAA